MTPRDIQWRKRARSVACLSKRIETEIERSRFRTARGAYTGGALAYARRLFTAIERLCPENELEASVLLRTLMEIWVNTQWICHGRMNRKAERFFKFELVETVSQIEKAPAPLRTGVFADAEKRWRSDRDQHARRTFYTRSRKRRMRWENTWANDHGTQKDLAGRIRDLQKWGVVSGDADNAGTVYMQYFLLHGAVHASPFGLNQLIDTQRGCLRDVPRVNTFEPLKTCSSILLDLTGLAAEKLKLTEFREDHSRELRLHRKIPPNPDGVPT